MAKENKGMNNLLKFLATTAVCIAAGYGLGLLAMWAYQTYMTGISLGFGESILILGFMACGVYTFTGLAIALAYQKFMK